MTMLPVVLLLLALVGIADTVWLSQVHLFGGACGEGSGCSAVLASDYTRVFGLPLSALGLGFYLAVAGLAWRGLPWAGLAAAQRDDSMRWISALSALAVVPVIVLVYLQGFVIGAWCPYCLLSAVLIGLLSLTSVVCRRQTNSHLPLVTPLPGLRVGAPLLVVLVSPSLLFLGVEKQSQDQAGSDLPAMSLATHHVAASIGDRDITLGELDEAIRLQLTESRTSMRERWLDLQVLETEAAAAGLTVSQLMQQKVVPPQISQQQIDAFYETNVSRMPADVARSQLDPQIRQQLRRDGHGQAQTNYIGQLRQHYGTQLSPPAAERFAIDANPLGAPERGPTDAAITIVGFSDLACSYCARDHRRLDELQAQLPGQLRVIFRHFPLDMHPDARLAAEVAACADEQDRFWPMVEVLFDNQRQLESQHVREYAVELGLDMTRLDECLAAGRGQAVVDADIAQGDALGVTSTPSFFINGHYFKNLPSVDRLRQFAGAGQGN